jgi:hypothetical protein
MDATPNRHVATDAPARDRRRPSYLWGVVGGMSLFVGTLMMWPDHRETGELHDIDGLQVATSE